jgi:hypothetical protein
MRVGCNKHTCLFYGVAKQAISLRIRLPLDDLFFLVNKVAAWDFSKKSIPDCDFSSPRANNSMKDSPGCANGAR